MRTIIAALLSALWLGGANAQVRIEFPAITHLTGAQIAIGERGARVERYNAVFRNGVTLPAIAVVVGYGKELARLGPGGVAVGNRLLQWHHEVVPVTALFYEEVGGTPGKFIGLAWGKVYLYPGQPVSQPVTFRLEDILRPDGSYFYSYGYGRSLDHPAPVADLREQVVHLPRKWWSGTNGLQMVNGSLFTIRVRINGNLVVATLPPEGGFAYLEERIIYGLGTIRSIQVDYLQSVGDKYLLVQSSPPDIHLGLNPQGITGRQLIVGPPTRGAQLY